MRAFVMRLSLAAASILAVSACQTDDAKSPPTASGTIGDGDGAPDGTSTDTASDPQSPDGPAPSQQYVTLTKETMDFAGRTRRYLLAKPKDYDAAKTQPLVPYREVENTEKLPPFAKDEGMPFGRQTHLQSNE